MSDLRRNQLIEDLAAMEIHPVLAAVGQLTGDRRVLDGKFTPAKPVVTATTLPNGGLDEATVVQARELVADILIGSLSATPGQGVSIEELVHFLTGIEDEALTQRLEREIDAPHEAPTPATPAQPERSMNVAIIGAGMSGIAAAYRLAVEGHDYTIFDQRSDFGGTWTANRYPGCRLDTSNFIYSYTFAPKSDWNDRYSLRQEILDYFVEVARTNGMYEHARFNTAVTALRWIDDAGVWEVTHRENGVESVDRFDAVVTAVGQLSKPSIPAFKGAEKFQGVQVHSAEWPEDLDLTDKKVALVGSGASGFQILPAIVDQVASATVFQRTPPFLLPTADYHDSLPEAVTRLIEEIPTLATWHRFWMFWIAVDGRYPLALVDPEWESEDGTTVSQSNAAFRAQLVDHLAERFESRPDLLDQVVPTYAAGAKRLLRDNGAWPAALQSDKVTLDRGPIVEITETGVRTAQGQEYDLDVIIYATGFRASEFLEDIEVTGAGGRNLADVWHGEPRAYLGITVPEFPNLFMLYGPNTNLVVNGSLIFMIECALDYVMGCIDEAVRANASVDTSREALADFVAWMNQGNDVSAWGVSDVSSWYKNANGVVTQNWPHPLTEYWRVTREFDPSAHRLVPLPDHSEAATLVS